jgi:hypothetical protein
MQVTEIAPRCIVQFKRMPCCIRPVAHVAGGLALRLIGEVVARSRAVVIDETAQPEKTSAAEAPAHDVSMPKDVGRRRTQARKS